MKVEAYIDALFALYMDSKSHTGVNIFVGGSVVYVSSKKQKGMTKSPTKAELVGFLENLGVVELVEDLTCFITNRQELVPVIYQDSTSVISLITKGGGIARTKHLRARMNLGKEAVDENKVLIIYKRFRKDES